MGICYHSNRNFLRHIYTYVTFGKFEIYFNIRFHLDSIQWFPRYLVLAILSPCLYGQNILRIHVCGYSTTAKNFPLCVIVINYRLNSDMCLSMIICDQDCPLFRDDTELKSGFWRPQKPPLWYFLVVILFIRKKAFEPRLRLT